LFCLGLNDFLFAYLFDELSFDDRCYRYWNRYLVALSDSVDRELIFERASLNCLRQSWVDREFSIKCLRVSKRFIDNDSVLERCMKWICSNSSLSSIPEYDLKEIQLLRLFPESFFPQSSSLFFSVCSCSALCFFMIIFLLHDIFHSVSCYTLGFTLCTPFFFMDILLVSFILDFGSSMFWFSFLSLILCFSFNYLTFVLPGPRGHQLLQNKKNKNFIQNCQSVTISTSITDLHFHGETKIVHETIHNSQYIQEKIWFYSFKTNLFEGISIKTFPKSIEEKIRFNASNEKGIVCFFFSLFNNGKSICIHAFRI